MDVSKFEKLLDARYIGEYEHGHMNSQILRFQNTDNKIVVLKFAPSENKEATEDIEANLYGYESIRIAGGSSLIPFGLEELKVEKGRALVMQDLGDSMRKRNGGLQAGILFWNYFKESIILGTKREVIPGNFPPSFISEILSHIKHFSYAKTFEILRILEKSNWDSKWGMSTLMLLDFTPDNVFLGGNHLSFIDPWRQGTYFGHPAVSMGQFATLTSIYKMRDSKKIELFLKYHCASEMPKLLSGDKHSVSLAFRLGATLQYILSAYVRKDSDPIMADEFIKKACTLWEIKGVKDL